MASVSNKRSAPPADDARPAKKAPPKEETPREVFDAAKEDDVVEVS